MIKVYVKKQSYFGVNTSNLKKKLKDFLEKEGIVSDSVVSVSIVGEKKMRELSKKFLGEQDSVHNVLSFVESEATGDFVYPPGDIIRLGEIVICYPKVVEEAQDEGKMIDKKVVELAEHGALHLLGKHHEY